MQQEFEVTWTVKVVAASSEDAAQKARVIQRHGTYACNGSRFHVSEVEQPAPALGATVDLSVWEPDFRTADGHPVRVGGVYWDNNLELVIVRQVADHDQYNENTGERVWWHRCERLEPERGSGMTFDGSRLARFHPVSRKRASEAAVELGMLRKLEVRN